MVFHAWLVVPLTGALARERLGRRGLLLATAALTLLFEAAAVWNWRSTDLLALLPGTVTVIGVLTAAAFWWWPRSVWWCAAAMLALMLICRIIIRDHCRRSAARAPCWTGFPAAKLRNHLG